MKYKKIIIGVSVIIISIGATYLMSRYHLVYRLEHAITSDYILAFMAGILFISFFTVVPAGYILVNLLPGNDPLLVALIAGLGAAAGDLMIFLFVKEHLSYSLLDFLNFWKHDWIGRLKENRAIRILLPVIGAAIIASPFPDEIGVSLMGVARVKKRYFIPISFALNSIGIYILLVLSKVV